MVNSVIISGFTTLIAMVVGVFTAYALARLDFKGKFVVLGFVLAASIFPGVALITPLWRRPALLAGGADPGAGRREC